MWRELGLTKRDWDRTPQAVRSCLVALHHQVRLMNIRFTAYEQQIAHLKEQVTQVDDLKAEVAELKERLGQNSRNSSQPPSSDPPSQKPPREAKASSRQRGGQPGHQGRTRQLLPVTDVDHVVELLPKSCQQCGHLLRGRDKDPQRHQVWEVPRVKAEVTEYRRHRLWCEGCGTQNTAEWPKEASSGGFGPHAQSVVGYLTGRMGASHRDCVEALAVLYGLSVGVGSVAAIQRRVSQALNVPVEQARKFVQQQKAQYVDETSWIESGEAKWLWVNATRDVTVFEVLCGRRTSEAHRVIHEEAKGIITTDRYGAYTWLPGHRRQICWAHLVRDFQALVDRGGESSEVGQALLKQSRRMFALWHKIKEGTISRAQLQSKIKSVRRQVKGWLEVGQRVKQAKTRRTCANILKVEGSLWTFVRMEGVEPTNNMAERSLRRGVLWRRKSFGTQSGAGSQFVGRILTVVQTLRQQGREVLEYLTAACREAIGGGEIKGLVPDTS